MELNSLGRKTDLMFSKFSGRVLDKGNYFLVQTPSNPTYHWGNYIIFDHAPKIGDFKRWTDLFNKEFPYYTNNDHHLLFTWDTPQPDRGAIEEFLENKFVFDSAFVLTAGEVTEPPKFNDKIYVRKLLTDNDWEVAIKNAALCGDPKFFSSTKACEDFERVRMGQYREMSSAGLGNWFGAFLGEQLVGDLGIFYDKGIGRFQNVGTHPEYRRQGVCGTLVYKTAQVAYEEFGIKTLVMEADADYHAAKIYESVGFKKTETNYALTWWKNK